MKVDLTTLYKRVSDWNAARYDRELNVALAHNLLREEFDELLEAIKPVDQLDALCDISYIALGIIWKCNLDDEQQLSQLSVNGFNLAIGMDNMNAHAYVEPLLLGLIEQIKKGEDHLIEFCFAIIALSAFQSGMRFGFNLDHFFTALDIVCDSNDTKPAKKTASDVKANIDKGATFVAPEPRLQKLLDKVEKMKELEDEQC